MQNEEVEGEEGIEQGPDLPFSSLFLEQDDGSMSEFVLESLISQGGFGQVKKAINVDTQAKVVIKIARPRTPELVTLIEKEREALRRLKRLRGCTTIATPQGAIYFTAMDFILGDALEDFPAQPQFKMKHTLKIFQSALLGLQTIHKEKIIHRDINPSNLIVSPRAEGIEFIDFGLVLFPENEHSDPEKGAGTEGYIAPEIDPDGLENIYTVKCDIWSLGKSLEKLLEKTVHDPADLYYQNLYNLVLDMMQKDPEKRPTIETCLKRRDEIYQQWLPPVVEMVQPPIQEVKRQEVQRQDAKCFQMVQERLTQLGQEIQKQFGTLPARAKNWLPDFSRFKRKAEQVDLGMEQREILAEPETKRARFN